MPDAHQFSDYIVYVDESGDHSLTSINADFPVFTLAFCVFEKSTYLSAVVPAMETMKFEMWGHDSVIFHESDIRSQSGPFRVLRRDPTIRETFFARLNDFISAAPFDIIASTIDKRRHVAKYATPMNPYDIAMFFCLERLLQLMIRRGQANRQLHVVFEARGRNEDRDLEVAFHRVCNNQERWGWRREDFRQMSFVPQIVPKTANSTGLQLADLVARPIALQTLRPGQPNRAFDLIRPKIHAEKVFP